MKKSLSLILAAMFIYTAVFADGTDSLKKESASTKALPSSACCGSSSIAIPCGSQPSTCCCSSSIAIPTEFDLVFNLKAAIEGNDPEQVKQILAARRTNPNNLPYLITLPTIEMARILLKGGLNPNNLFMLITEYPFSRSMHHEEQVALINCLVKELRLNLGQALKNYYPTRPSSNNIHLSADTLKFCLDLDRSGELKSNIARHTKLRGLDYFTINNLNCFLGKEGAGRAINKLFGNLNAPKPSPAPPKFPRILHSVWCPSRSQELPQREIPEQDIQSIIKHKQQFADWQYFLWTNDARLMPRSAAQLHAAGITVKEIRELPDYEFCPNLRGQISQWINDKQFGMVSDAVRMWAVYYFGGIYIEPDYEITPEGVRHINDNVIYTHNFFGVYAGGIFIDDFFFAASQQHPILKIALTLIERNSKTPPPYISALKNKKDITYETTSHAFFIASLQAANSEENVDVVYPIVSTINHDYPSITGVIRYFYPPDKDKDNAELDKLLGIVAEIVPEDVAFLRQEHELLKTIYFHNEKMAQDPTWHWINIGIHNCTNNWAQYL